MLSDVTQSVNTTDASKAVRTSPALGSALAANVATLAMAISLLASMVDSTQCAEIEDGTQFVDA